MVIIHALELFHAIFNGQFCFPGFGDQVTFSFEAAAKVNVVGGALAGIRNALHGSAAISVERYYLTP